jgi:hypothetical protein
MKELVCNEKITKFGADSFVGQYPSTRIALLFIKTVGLIPMLRNGKGKEVQALDV